MEDDDRAFEKALARVPSGYSEGTFDGRRWGATMKRSDDGKRSWLFAEELGGTDFVSANIYVLREGFRLKPCEMAAEKVIAFIEGYKSET